MGVLCHQVGLLQIGVVPCAMAWTRPCSLHSLYQYKHLADQAGDAGKCVFREEVIYQETGKVFYMN